MAYITTEEVKSIRKALKEEFGSTIKFSVTNNDHIGVNITVIESTEIDFTSNPEYSYLEMNGGSRFVCPYLDNRAQKTLDRIKEIAKTALAADGGKEWFDESDSMTDYFHLAYYVWVNVGKWNKPYTYKGDFAGQSKVVIENTMYVFDDSKKAYHFEKEAEALLAA